MSKPPPLICEKCHRRRLHPKKDKGHRWCKQCRAAAFAKAANLTPDQQRINRVGYEYTAMLALLRELQNIRVVKQTYEKGTYYQLLRARRKK